MSSKKKENKTDLCVSKGNKINILLGRKSFHVWLPLKQPDNLSYSPRTWQLYFPFNEAELINSAQCKWRMKNETAKLVGYGAKSASVQGVSITSREQEVSYWNSILHGFQLSIRCSYQETPFMTVRFGVQICILVERYVQSLIQINIHRHKYIVADCAGENVLFSHIIQPKANHIIRHITKEFPS